MIAIRTELSACKLAINTVASLSADCVEGSAFWPALPGPPGRSCGLVRNSPYLRTDHPVGLSIGRSGGARSRVPSSSSPFLLGFDEIERALDRVAKAADG